jgi:hypothetical protein
VPVVRSAEPPPPADTDAHLPDWLPMEQAKSYVNYVERHVPGLDLMRFPLDTGDHARVRQADLEEDGHTAVVLLEVDAVCRILETGHLRDHRPDDRSQISFRGLDADERATAAERGCRGRGRPTHARQRAGAAGPPSRRLEPASGGPASGVAPGRRAEGRSPSAPHPPSVLRDAFTASSQSGAMMVAADGETPRRDDRGGS